VRLKNGVLSQQPLPQTAEPLTIRTLLEDCEGNLWLGTLRHGLYRIRHQVVTTFSTQQGLKQSNVYPVLEDSTGDIWLGGWRGGFSRLSAGRYTNIQHTRIHYPRALALDPAGRVAVGLANGYGLWEDNRLVIQEVPELKTETPAGSSLNYEPVILTWDRQGALWLAADHVGLLRFQQGVTTRWRPADGLMFDTPKALLESRDGSLWLGGYGGLARYQNGQMAYFTAQNGLPGNTVRCLHEDAEGVLWVGTYDSGLGRYANGRWTSQTPPAKPGA